MQKQSNNKKNKSFEIYSHTNENTDNKHKHNLSFKLPWFIDFNSFFDLKFQNAYSGLIKKSNKEQS